MPSKRVNGRKSARVKFVCLLILSLLCGLCIPLIAEKHEVEAAPAPLAYDFSQMGLKKKDNTNQPLSGSNHNLALVGDQTAVNPKVYGGNYGVSIESSLTQTTRAFTFDVPSGGLYAFSLKAALSTDGGIADINVDPTGGAGTGTKVFASFEFYKNATDSVFRTVNAPSPVLLSAGTHTVSFTVVSRKNATGPAYMFPYVLTLTEQPITMAPAAATFNKDAPSDVTVAMSVYRSLVSIHNGSRLLSPGTDYIAGDYDVTIRKEYLSTQEAGTVPLTFDVLYGTNPQLTVNVTDPLPETLLLDFTQLSFTDTNTGWYLTKLNPDAYPKISARPYGIELAEGPGAPIRSVSFQVYHDGIYDIDFTGSLFSGGTADIFLDTDAYEYGGAKVFADFSFYKSDTNAKRTVRTATPVYLQAGPHKFTFVYTGKNPASTSTYLYPTSFVLTRLANTIDPRTAVFDRIAPSDLSVTMSVYESAAFSRLMNGTTPLQPGTDYTVDGATVTVKKAYLLVQPLGTTVLTFDFTRKNDPSLTVSVTDSTPVLSPSAVSFNKNPSAQTDATVTMSAYGHAFKQIRSGTSVLTRDKDYTVTPTSITLKKAYLSGLPTGTTSLTVDFEDVTGPVIAVNVIDTSTTISPARTAYDKRNAAQQDAQISLAAYGSAQLTDVYADLTKLTAGTDYTAYGGTVTLKKSALSMLAGGMHAVQFKMSAGNDPVLTLYALDDPAPTAQLSALTAGLSGSNVTLAGTIDSGAGQRITVKVTDPNGSIAFIGQTVSGAGGSIGLSFTLSSPIAGTYTVKAGGQQAAAVLTTAFTY